MGNRRPISAPVRSAPVSQNEKLVVYVAGQHPLATFFLLGALAKDASLCVTTVERLVHYPPAASPPAVFVLDNNGLEPPLGEWLRVLRKRHPEGKFLVVDELRTPEEIAKLLSLGIHGFVTYPEVEDQLSAAIHSVAAGRMCMPPGVLEAHARRSVPSFRSGNFVSFGEITPRENQVMELVRRRFSNKEIGSTLGLSESTVKFHVSNILSKMQMTERSALYDRAHIGKVWEKLSTMPVRETVKSA